MEMRLDRKRDRERQSLGVWEQEKGKRERETETKVEVKVNEMSVLCAYECAQFKSAGKREIGIERRSDSHFLAVTFFSLFQRLTVECVYLHGNVWFIILLFIWKLCACMHACVYYFVKQFRMVNGPEYFFVSNHFRNFGRKQTEKRTNNNSNTIRLRRLTDNRPNIPFFSVIFPLFPMLFVIPAAGDGIVIFVPIKYVVLYISVVFISMEKRAVHQHIVYRAYANEIERLRIERGQ